MTDCAPFSRDLSSGEQSEQSIEQHEVIPITARRASGLLFWSGIVALENGLATDRLTLRSRRWRLSFSAGTASLRFRWRSYAADAQHSRPRRVELRRNAVSGHLGGHAVLRPGLQALPRRRPAHRPSRRADQRRRQGADRPDRRDGHADLCLYRRRSAEAQRRLRADPLRRRTKACRWRSRPAPRRC